MVTTGQNELFARAPAVPEGFLYRAGFLRAEEESELLRVISALPLEEASYKQWTAKRRVVSYGKRYDFDQNRLHPAEPIPDFLEPLLRRISAWTAVPLSAFKQSVIAEYRPGTQLGWHRDVPDFEWVAGVSLAGSARMRFRPYSSVKNQGRATSFLDLEPRSAYAMSGPARWQWQHAISPTSALRYSITFRTLAARAPR